MSKTIKKECTVLHHNTINAVNARCSTLGFASSKDYETTQTAIKLRLEISPPLPTPLTSKALKKGQMDAPADSLVHFFRVLCTGSEMVGDHDSRSERYACLLKQQIMQYLQVQNDNDNDNILYKVILSLLNRYVWEWAQSLTGSR